MIKVNLLKTKVQTASHTVADEETQDFTGFENFDDGPVVDQGDAAVKLLLVALATIGLMVYEWYNKSELEKRLKSSQALTQVKTQELNTLQGQGGDSSNIKGEIEEIKSKIDIMDELSKKRLKELQALDYLQSNIPDGVWMKSIDYDGRLARLEGFSVTEKDLDDFIVALEKSRYFIKVERLSSVTSGDKNTTFKEFKLSSLLGEAN